MKISAKGRYGLEAMLYLAVNCLRNEATPIYKISETQGISLRYLEQVFSLLKKSGLVKSIKGNQGGYFLAYEPKDISVGDIVRAIEGEVGIVKNLTTEDVNKLNTIESCIYNNVWTDLNDCINKKLNETTLDDLAKKHQISKGYSSFDFQI